MEKILEVKKLKTSFRTHLGDVKAVRGVSFYVNKGEALGIVGESGCGKSVTMMSIMRLLAENANVECDEILFNGEDISKYTERQMEEIRGEKMGMIFQDPMTSLNPLYTIGNQLIEHYMKHKKVSKDVAWKRGVEMLGMVGIPSPESRMKQYPHEFSGGMRQRAMIAISLMCEPELIIADEPTTALDVTIQAQILDVMKDLKAKLNTAIILITHDLGVVADLCARINVMYGGVVVETGTDRDIFYKSEHPYTWGLLKSVPDPMQKEKEKLTPIDGQPPDLLKPPVGCPFADRCEHTMKICMENLPPLFDLEEGHKSRCWLCHKDAPKVLEEKKIRKGKKLEKVGEV